MNLSPPLVIRHLGLMPYEPVWRAMQRFTDQRDEHTADQVWCVQHPPVFTQGQAGRAEHVLAPGDIPVVQVDRGGQVTYHGPGQIVVYPLLDLRRLGLGVRELVTRIEGAIIQVLDGYGIEAQRREGAPGVYVGEAKIAALGLRVRRGCSFHGLAFNINNDLEPFSRINPCGYEGLAVTRLTDLADTSLAQAETALLSCLAYALGYNKGFRRADGLPATEG
ncbi:lipoyl(octanoyl) transferase LipB [Marinihelvus fidelis]|uniref:Octanoyltransferase n=1 Tax=Marinihelvus fidelis TaxID=2613842 RepID=A0A5N0T956_9GAMM|nr:lipoyl(octanoyl) transferase LipB [Marinihelvus fidelis]KAA9131014.1 lipoyl(octanoyl) transferase LipB [Marinihelvus fidelis]